MSSSTNDPIRSDLDAADLERVAAAVRDACLEAALRAYEDAGIQGLCAEGRWEAAVGAMQSIDASSLLDELRQRVMTAGT